MNRFVHVVTPLEAGIRLDRLLTSHLKGLSRATIQKTIGQGAIFVNGRNFKASHKLQAGDRIEAVISQETTGAAELQQWDFSFERLHEDEHLLAINKPPGVVVHPGAGRRTHTIANAIVTQYPQLRNVGHPLRPGVVHRLDRQTSGVLLIAKNQEAYHKLVDLFKNRQIEKHYRALAYGGFYQKTGTIDSSLGRDPRNRKRMSVRARKSRAAATLYRVIRQYDFAALLDVQIVTGRTHQIRVHLASLNHPIVGDALYGGGDWNRIRNDALRAALKKSDFFGLHAFSLDLRHPATGRPLHIEAPLPEIWNLI